VRTLRNAVDRVTRALQYLDDSSGRIGEDLRALMALYAHACRTSPPPAAPLATWLVELAWDGPGWPEVRLADFAPALGLEGLARIAALVAERTAAADPDSWHDEWAAQYLREQLAAASGDVDAYVADLAEDLKHPDRYRTIAAILRDAGRAVDATSWARRGLADHPRNPNGDRLRDLLVDLLIDATAPCRSAARTSNAARSPPPTAPSWPPRNAAAPTSNQ